ncbi:PfkB family carbohydrate kinase [Okibacterium fritillariae]|uniref:PfkB family carbohydrate kinase n=1 Tax=Okibacterium fritillariae TaxID=123320 RepID=UPI0009A84CFC
MVAGDAFVAGWLAETVAGASLEHRLETAVQCGALACTVDGDWEAAPTRADVTPASDKSRNVCTGGHREAFLVGVRQMA